MMTTKSKANYRLPINAPKWKLRLHAHALRLARLIELNAPDLLIKREVAILNGVIFDAVEVTVMDDTTNVKGNGQAAPQIGEGANDGNN